VVVAIKPDQPRDLSGPTGRSAPAAPAAFDGAETSGAAALRPNL